MEKRKVDYETIDFLSRALAFRFKLNGREFTHVIGVSRGGLLPAEIISYVLDAKFLAYGASSYDDKEQKSSLAVTQDIDFDSLPEDSRLLIVDDKCDTGKTIDHMKEVIGDRFDYVRYATVFAEKRSIKKVDHYGVVLPDHTWIDFPWE
ncbi:MAG: phosphoribosyltransferase family protein [Deltaproteobacteria bacterium]|jgi:xanthine phosphoribosyltransferase|nr:phosphoribosyltransferase family protein [Deltaproteobacteria bacterium]